MKVRCLLFLVMSLVLCGSASAQVRHVKKIKSIEAGYGMNNQASSVYAGYVYYFTNKLYGKASAFYATGSENTLKYNSIGLDVSPGIQLKTFGESIYINARPGLTVSMDKLSPSIDVYDVNGNVKKESYSTVKFGLFAGIETELFINDKFVLVLGWNQRYMLNKDKWGQFRWFGNVGIRYNL